jgi:hypothetical protein
MTISKGIIAFHDGVVAEEELPFRYVYYPGFYGAFFAFSDKLEDQLFLCECSKPAVENYVNLKQKPGTLIGYHEEPEKQAILDSQNFPLAIAKKSAKRLTDISWLTFEKGLCHRCNIKKPAHLYCHEQYGGKFIQGYGWYVKLTSYLLGIRPAPFGGFIHPNISYLQEECSIPLAKDIEGYNQLATEYNDEYGRLLAIAGGPQRVDIPPDEITYWTNVREEDAQLMIQLRRASAIAYRRVTKQIEDMVRQDFGFKKVGEGWISETILYHIVERIFREKEVLFHHRPDWLGGLELDIFIPYEKLALEYQGQQHYFPIKAWGGEKALEKVREHDRRKVEMCKKYDIRLLLVTFRDSLTEDFVRNLIKKP